VGLSAPAVKRRVDRLQMDGVIRGFTAVVDPGALGWTTEAFIAVFCEGRTNPDRIRTAAAKHPEVIAAYTVTGDHDALLHVRVRDTAHLEEALERISGPTGLDIGADSNPEVALSILAEALAARFAVRPSDGGEHRLAVDGIETAAHYNEVQDFLEALTGVDSVRVLSASEATMTFSVRVSTDGLRQRIALTGPLEFLRHDLATDTLFYRFSL
jgi:DNA-binding Lrp family transcriptional regulator